jgi:DNA-binding CsgD family transcriptional regulator
MSAAERLGELVRAAGAGRGALFRSRGGLLGADPPVCSGPSPVDAEELLEVLGRASALSASSVEQAAQLLAQELGVPRRRDGRGNVLRVPLGRSPAELVLFRSDAPAGPGLEAALAALESEALAWELPPDVRAACAFVALDDRTTLLLAADGELLAMSASMRRALGAGVPTGSFVAPPRCRQFLTQLRELALHPAHGVREEARGLSAPGTVSIERHEPGDLLLARVLGPADLQARITALASADMTPREIACGVELAAGKSYRAIAGVLHVSPDTVKLHLRALYQKLGVSGREQFVAVMAEIAVPPRRARS